MMTSGSRPESKKKCSESRIQYDVTFKIQSSVIEFLTSQLNDVTFMNKINL
jgi:hypothetical protein